LWPNAISRWLSLLRTGVRKISVDDIGDDVKGGMLSGASGGFLHAPIAERSDGQS